MPKTVTCPNCGFDIPENDDYCRCGTHKPVLPDNYCENPACERYMKPIDYYQNHCGKCNKLTHIGKTAEKYC